MVIRFLIIAILLSAAPADTAELCLKCHKPHYKEIGSCKPCHRGNQATVRKDLAHKGIIKGRYARFMTADEPLKAEWDSRLNALGCRRCHTIGGEGNSIATDLDRSAQKKSPEELVAVIMNPAKAMPDFRLDDGTVDEVVTALLAASLKGSSARKSAVQLVHFDSSGAKREDVFSRKCGGCHKALTRGKGLLGRGAAAPDLSGLFSPYYPAGEKWNIEKLEKWLQNPRKVRISATMQPVEISKKELLELKKLLE